MKCCRCDKPIEGRHWRAYVGPPCERPMSMVCTDCHDEAVGWMSDWSEITHGEVQWFEAVGAD